jgi:hypothetical protein
VTIIRIVVAVLLGSCSPEPRCVDGRDLHAVARDHEAAWSAAFDGRALTDRELIALADGQAVLECLAER